MKDKPLETILKAVEVIEKNRFKKHNEFLKKRIPWDLFYKMWKKDNPDLPFSFRDTILIEILKELQHLNNKN